MRVTNLSFAQALELLKQGHRIQRYPVWADAYIFLVDGSTFNVSRAPLDKFYPVGTPINYCAHIDMCYDNGEIAPWVANQVEMLANDWAVLADDVEQVNKEHVEEAMLRKNKINALLKRICSIPDVTVLSCAIYDPDLSMGTFYDYLDRIIGYEDN